MGEVETCSPAANAKSFDATTSIADSSFTVQWIFDQIEAGNEEFARLIADHRVTNVTAVDISQGKGFISKVYKIAIEFEDHHDFNVVLKLPGIESLCEAMANTDIDTTPLKDAAIADCHNRECQFYDNFAPHMDIPLPKIYKTVEWVVGKQQGAILMESLFGTTEMCPVSTGASLQQLFALAKHMATTHSYFLCLPEEQWLGKYSSGMFASMAKHDFFGPCFNIIKAKKPGVFDRGIEVFSKYIREVKFMSYCMCDVYKDVGLPPVLTHGDLWTNNVLWKKNADGSISNEVAAIIDWQIMHEGCMTSDIARFLAICADGEIRREYQDRILQYYYDTIVKLMAEKGKTADFTMDQIMRAFKVNFVVQSMMAMIMGPFLYPDTNKEGDPSVQQAKLEKLLLRAQFAMEDGLEYLKDIPEEKLI